MIICSPIYGVLPLECNGQGVDPCRVICSYRVKWKWNFWINGIGYGDYGEWGIQLFEQLSVFTLLFLYKAQHTHRVSDISKTIFIAFFLWKSTGKKWKNTWKGPLWYAKRLAQSYGHSCWKVWKTIDNIAKPDTILEAWSKLKGLSYSL